MNCKHTVSGSKKTQNRGNAVGEVTRSAWNLFNIIFSVTLECYNPTVWWPWLFVIIMAKRVQLYLCMHSYTCISIYPELYFAKKIQLPKQFTQWMSNVFILQGKCLVSTARENFCLFTISATFKQAQPSCTPSCTIILYYFSSTSCSIPQDHQRSLATQTVTS